MIMSTLLEAHQRFAAVLDELRRKYVAEFEQWLKTAADEVSQKDASERIATARRKFADEFLDQRAPAIVRSFNRDAEHDILAALKSYDARPEPAPARQPMAGGLRWQATLWRTVLAAAFGAVAAVTLLALQLPPGDPLPAPAPPTVNQPDQPSAPPRDANPPAPTVQPQAAPAPPSTVFIFVREKVVLWLLAAAFAAALGAAIGVFIVAAPSVPALLQRMGLSGTPLKLVRRLSATFAILRAGPLIMLLAALLTGFFALIAWLLDGSKPLNVAVGLTAIAAVLTARWTAPAGAGPDRDTLHRQFVGQLDSDLKADANVWAALSAALVLKRDDGRARVATELREITNIILARRAQKETGEDILQVIEQQLGLPSGPQTPVTPKAEKVASEFVWKPEHAQDYTTFGAVDVGEVVTVSSRPLYIEDASGAKRVSQKGVVTRKR